MTRYFRIPTLILSIFFSFFLTAQADNTTLSSERQVLISPSTRNVIDATPTLIPPPPNFDVKAYILIDADSGTVIAQSNMDQRLPPASLTKLMTLYLTFQALKSNQIHLTDTTRVSNQAWHTGGSRMFIREGSEITVDSLIQGVVVASGNDACVSLAQYIAGTEETFTQMMNQTAQRLGMKDTHFTDSTGLPHPKHYSTAHDLALLAQALIRDFPDYYHYFSQKWIMYDHVKQPNRNRLLWHDTSVDGLKTGHTEEAGFCLIASAVRHNMRLISVMLGAPTENGRNNYTESLFNYGFRFYQTYVLFKAHQPISQRRVWFGSQKMVNFGLTHPLYVTIPANEYSQLKASLSLSDKLKAPIVQDQSYGDVEVTLNGKTIINAPLVALEDDARGHAFSRMLDHLAFFIRNLIKGSS